MASVEPEVVEEIMAPVILQQPEDQVAPFGTEVIYGIVAENADTYRWQYSSNGGASWINISATWTGYNSDILVFNTTNARYNYLYRCAVTGNGVTVYSDPVRLIKE